MLTRRETAIALAAASLALFVPLQRSVDRPGTAGRGDLQRGLQPGLAATGERRRGGTRLPHDC